MRKYWWLVVAFCLFTPAMANAQAARPTDNFQWDMENTPLEDASLYKYFLELDNALLSNPLEATCVANGTSSTCKAPIPAITPSQHTVRLRAVDMRDPTLPIIGEWSDPYSFTMRATPGKPKNLVIIPAKQGN